MSLVHFHHGLLLDGFEDDCSPTTDDQHDPITSPFLWLALLVLLPYLDASEEIGLQGIDSLGCVP